MKTQQVSRYFVVICSALVVMWSLALTGCGSSDQTSTVAVGEECSDEGATPHDPTQLRNAA